LRNKSTKDCVRFYYDSKQAVPYKGALREHIMRRKRRGDYHVWDATIEAALSVGAIIEAGANEDKPLIFLLPENDHTYHTRKFHPMKREVFDAMIIDQKVAAKHKEDPESPKRPGRKRVRARDPLFVLDSSQAKYLKTNIEPPQSPIKPAQSRSSMADAEDTADGGSRDEGGLTPARKAPQKWTAAEKKIFIDTLEKHGRNWNMLAESVGTKSISQIKNYYYDFKKQAGKPRPDKKPIKGDVVSKPKKREPETSSTPPPANRPESVLDTPLPEEAFQQDLASPSLSVPSLDHGDYQSLQSQQFAQAQQVRHQQLAQSQAHVQQGQNQQYPYRSDDVYTSRSYQQTEAERSHTSTPDAMELWAHAQQQALLHQNQHISEDAARRLLQHHSHTQHQQILSNLLPWVNSNQLSQGASQNEWPDSQQLRQLLQLQQQQQQHHHQPQQRHHQQPQQQGHHHPHHHQQQSHAHSQLAALGLSSLAGLNLGQQHHHHHQPPQQPQLRQQSSDEAQLALAQHLLNLQGGSAAEALSLLARALPDRNNRGGGNHGPR
jgi:Myb-like DNA-binding domain